jgi:cyclase
MRISDHCHALLGFSFLPPWTVNAGVAWGMERTLVIDTGPSALAAATIHGYAELARPGNALVAINSEGHLDHIGGNDYFRQLGLDVHGHASIQRTEGDLAEDIAAYSACVADPIRRADGEGRLPFVGTRIANPNKPIAADTVLDLGGREATILLAPGHTPANLLVWIADEGVLFAGDTIVSGYGPNLGTGGPPAWTSWLAALNRIEDLRPRVIVPGHGEVIRHAEIPVEIERIRSCLARALDTATAGSPAR